MKKQINPIKNKLILVFMQLWHAIYTFIADLAEMPSISSITTSAVVPNVILVTRHNSLRIFIIFWQELVYFDSCGQKASPNGIIRFLVNKKVKQRGSMFVYTIKLLQQYDEEEWVCVPTTTNTHFYDCYNLIGGFFA